MSYASSCLNTEKWILRKLITRDKNGELYTPERLAAHIQQPFTWQGQADRVFAESASRNGYGCAAEIAALKKRAIRNGEWDRMLEAVKAEKKYGRYKGGT